MSRRHFSVAALKRAGRGHAPAFPGDELLHAIRGLESNFEKLDSKFDAKFANNDLKFANIDAKFERLEKSIKEDTHAWFKMNERIIYLSGGAGLIALIMTAKIHHESTVMVLHLSSKTDRALERAQSTSDFLSGSLSGDVYAEAVKRARSKEHAVATGE